MFLLALVFFKNALLLCVEIALHCIDFSVWITLEKIASNQQNEVFLAAWQWFAAAVLSEIVLLAPGVNLLNIFQVFRDLSGRRNHTGHVPELTEIRATLIGRIFVPAQFARHFMIQADHVGFD